MNAHHERAKVLLEQNRMDLAEEHLRRALSEDPDDGLIHEDLAYCLLHLDRDQEALEAANQAIARMPENPRAFMIRGNALMALERQSEAREALEEARRLDPEDAGIHALLAQWHIGARDWLRALAEADRGLKLDPEHDGCANYRAFALTQLGRAEEAEASLQARLNRDPENAWTHAHRGMSLLHQGQAKQAAEAFRESLRLEPGNEFARNGLVEALKAKNPIYGLFLRFFLWMGRLQGFMVWGVIIGFVVVRVAIARLAEANPSWAPFLWPLYWGLMGFMLATWFISPLFNLVLLLNPLGRYALRLGDKIQSGLLLGMALTAGFLFLANLAGFLLGSTMAICCLLLILPAMVATDPDIKIGGRQIMAAVIAVLLVLSGWVVWKTHLVNRSIESADSQAKTMGYRDFKDFVITSMTKIAPMPTNSATNARIEHMKEIKREEDVLLMSVKPVIQARKDSQETMNWLLLAWVGSTWLGVFLQRKQ